MAGTKAGGLKAKERNLANDPDFYKKIGAIGGRNGNRGGFASDPELARRAGKIGGLKSRRGKSKKNVVDREELLYKLHNDNVSKS
jgi:uncharacterized protein